jgi:putative DNA primase/helicase
MSHFDTAFSSLRSNPPEVVVQILTRLKGASLPDAESAVALAQQAIQAGFTPTTVRDLPVVEPTEATKIAEVIEVAEVVAPVIAAMPGTKTESAASSAASAVEYSESDLAGSIGEELLKTLDQFDEANAALIERIEIAKHKAKLLPAPKTNINVVREMLARRYKPNQIIELRVPGVTKGDRTVVLGGLYTDHEKLIADVSYIIKQTDAPAIYTGLQQLRDESAYQAVVTNALKESQPGASAEDVARYTHLLIDIDTVRPDEFKKASSTDQEKAHGVEVLNAVVDYFEGLGYKGDVIDSGNSYHFVPALDLPATRENELLIQKVLESLAARFDTDHAKIDTGVFDRPRICKLPGTPARKGPDTKERPHRWSSVLSVGVLRPISVEDLLKIANLDAVPVPVVQVATTDENIRKSAEFLYGFLDWAKISYGPEQEHEGGLITVFESECPATDHGSGHHPGECHAGVNKEGKLAFACKHDACKGRGWKWFRSEVEKQVGAIYSHGITFGAAQAFAIAEMLNASMDEPVEPVEPDLPVAKVDMPVTSAPTVAPVEPINEPASVNLRELLMSGELTLTDAGVAEIFQAVFGNKYAHAVITRKGDWLYFNGKVWVAITEGKMLERIAGLSKAIRNTVLPTVIDEAHRKTLTRLADICGSGKAVSGALRFFEGMREIQRSEFDKQKFLFNFANGTYDLQTNELRKPRAEDMLTQTSPVAYNPAATCPTFQMFMDNGFTPLVQGYLQRYFGYAMLGDGFEKASLLFHGLGDNGKTILLLILLAIFGDYGMSSPWEAFAASKMDSGGRIRNDLARLHNVRLVVCDESKQDMELDEGTFKMATGNGVIISRFLNKEFFEYKAIYKLILATNNRPGMTNADAATWERVKDIAMMKSFRKGDPKRIEDLEDKLKAELEGIAAWIVEGWKEYQQVGLNPPEEILLNIAQYKQSADGHGSFFKVQNQFGTIALNTLYVEYRSWCSSLGEKARSLKAFRALVETLGYTTVKHEAEHGQPVYIEGLSLLRDQNQQNNQPNQPNDVTFSNSNPNIPNGGNAGGASHPYTRSDGQTVSD